LAWLYAGYSQQMRSGWLLIKPAMNVLLLRQPARVFIYVHGQIYVAGGKNAALKEDAENPF